MSSFGSEMIFRGVRCTVPGLQYRDLPHLFPARSGHFFCDTTTELPSGVQSYTGPMGSTPRANGFFRCGFHLTTPLFALYRPCRAYIRGPFAIRRPNGNRIADKSPRA